MMKKRIYLLLAGLVFSCSISAQQLNVELFKLIDLNRKGLEQVKNLYEQGQSQEAAGALLDYFRAREGIILPPYNVDSAQRQSQDKRLSDEALEHKFFSHNGYQPSFFYGNDIDWTYWPVVDNELRWQLHRHKWFAPMGRTYLITKDERYALAWIDQYMDWIKKNPNVSRNKSVDYELSSGESKSLENAAFAWRPLEVSHRLQDQLYQFTYFLNSPNFTPEFLSQFLVNYAAHAEHIIRNYSKQGNHLLFEGQRMVYAGTFFPELKRAADWRTSGVEVLNREIKIQVYNDGMQYELDPHYHLACINIFHKAYQMAMANGFADEFPQSFLESMHRMIEVEYNLSFPDYTNPMFGDAKLNVKEGMISCYNTWSTLFGDDKQIAYFASDGKQGTPPPYTSKAFKTSGFYVLRNGWQSNASVALLKAGPEAGWHNQPDNGTFELWIRGRNFMPDAGSYVYAGDKEVMELRNWFRQSMVHKTMTLDNRNIEVKDSKLQAWNGSGNVQYCWVENPSYEGFKHSRALFMIDSKFFVVVDQAIGSAAGTAAIHYQMLPGKITVDKQKAELYTNFEDGNNLLVKVFSDGTFTTKEEQGWVSTDYRKREQRQAFAFEQPKNPNGTVRYITVMLPLEDGSKAPRIEAKFIGNNSDKQINVELRINKKTYKLEIQK